MRTRYLYFFTIFVGGIINSLASQCGCKTIRKCYQDMLDALLDRDEEACVEDASIGSSTVTLYLKALKQFCPENIDFETGGITFEKRYLYEVTLSSSKNAERSENENVPVVLIEAGQDAGVEATTMALYIIEQLVACQESNDMLSKVKWVILPSTNPDGMEYSRYNRVMWKKNMVPSKDKFSFGVDITRNFDYQWGSCDKGENSFSPNFAGSSAGSENETIFITKAIDKYKKDMKLYLSLRRNGHGIFYPYSYTDTAIPNNVYITRVAADVAAKVNQRAGGVQLFLNQSIYDHNGKPQCGNSVDYAYNAGIPLAYEMQLFFAEDYNIMSMFQQLPRGFETSLRLGYLSGIRELYNAVLNEKKYTKVV